MPVFVNEGACPSADSVASVVDGFLERAEELRDAEVEHLDLLAPLVVDEDDDVVGLEVAVHDAELVRALERARGLPEQPRRLADAEPLDALEATAERLALEQLHDEVRLTLVGDAEVEDLHGVRAS